MPCRKDWHHDVDLAALPFVAFNEKEVRSKSDFIKFFVKYQGILYWTIDLFVVVIAWKFFLHPRCQLRKKAYFEMLLNIPSFLIMMYLGVVCEIQLNDIGIITLDHPLDLNAQIQPLRLPNEPIDYSEIARTTGWGEQQLVRNDEQQSRLMYVDLTYVPRENCSRLYDGWAFIEDGMLCYGESDGGKGACNGDSGGPLVCKVDNGTEYLCGLVSWGMVPCALAEFPSVRTIIFFQNI
ncbi:Kallikrein 1-related peptidase b3 [Orchesella cincta]|uniref:Kallikrein 1-related peptidase b3 n=1 Tax=Orchesella cincta TaxID=48709 RepID=A0A1D2NFJ3_ORCCI|nr:Kallikrein 1-related peptidase b3 [Orchesella cincta]